MHKHVKKNAIYIDKRENIQDMFIDIISVLPRNNPQERKQISYENVFICFDSGTSISIAM